MNMQEYDVSSFWQIPSTYAPERLDILRQLEKMKQMTPSDMGSDEEVKEIN